jgi:hypothetical protein
LSALKRSLVHAGLIVFALWPAVHIGLVKTWGVNPWKLAGWGMYSAPQIPPELRIHPLTVLTPDLEATRLEFLRARLGLGNLARPTRLARALLDRYPAIDGVSIEVVQPVLNRRTGIVAERTTTYEYRR